MIITVFQLFQKRLSDKRVKLWKWMRRQRKVMSSFTGLHLSLGRSCRCFSRRFVVFLFSKISRVAVEEGGGGIPITHHAEFFYQITSLVPRAFSLALGKRMSNHASRRIFFTNHAWRKQWVHRHFLLSWPFCQYSGGSWIIWESWLCLWTGSRLARKR